MTPVQTQQRPAETADRALPLRLAPRPPASRPAPPAQARPRPVQRVEAAELALQRWLVAHSMTLLRMSLGAVFLGFGFLKFFPGVSPAEDLAITTTSILTFHLVPASIALVAIAALECVIGVWLLSGRALRGVIVLLGIELVGIMSPVVLLAGRLFDGPHGAPTLEGQYVLKDVILVGAVLVLAAAVLGTRDPRAAASDRRPS